jgi:TATA-box binding protein (TBP) (component of TFIID and TFIIIB)
MLVTNRIFLLLFSSGKIVCAGSKSLEEAHSAIEQIRREVSG